MTWLNSKLFVLTKFYKMFDHGPGRPVIGLGSGDSSVQLGVIDEIDSWFKQVRDETCWSEMGHKGNPVPKLVAMQGEFVHDSEGLILHEPIYFFAE